MKLSTCAVFILIFSLICVCAFAQNQPPSADAGPDQIVDEGVEVVLDGSNSSDPDDGIASYTWLQTDGPEVSLSNPATVEPSFIPDVGVEGETFSFQLIVRDLAGATDTDTCTVKVRWVNSPPVADAGEDITVIPGMEVVLDGTGSQDEDDGIVSYRWEQLFGPTVTLSSHTSVRPSFSAPPTGTDGATLVFRLIVEDAGGLQSADTVTITLVYQAEEPVADAGMDQNVVYGSLVMLDASNSKDETFGIASYFWLQTSGPNAYLSNPHAMRPTFYAPEVQGEEEILTFQLTVTNHAGAKSQDLTTVTVKRKNRPPVANAGEDQITGELEEVTLYGSLSYDPDDGIAAYNWLQTGGIQAELSDSLAVTPTFIAPEVDENGASLTFQLTVTDKTGATATDSVTINISWKNTAPVANAGEDRTVSSGSVVTLSGALSSDPDDGIAYYRWAQLSGPMVTLEPDNTETSRFTAPLVGEEGESLVFELTVTDRSGLSSSSGVTIEVAWLNRPPVADAGPNINTVEEKEVMLDGSNSTDPDDGLASYKWLQTKGPQVVLSDDTAVQPTFTAPDVDPEGLSLTFELTVTDNGGLLDTDFCIVNINWINQPPHAVVSPDQTVSEGQYVLMDAGASWDPDDTIASYTWAQLEGPSVTLSDPNALSSGFIAPDVGEGGASLVFSLTVEDGAGLKDSTETLINITWVNQAPVAVAGEDKTVYPGDTVTLSAENSYDPDGDNLTFQWTQIHGVSTTLSDPAGPSPVFVALPDEEMPHVVVFQVMAEDPQGLKAKDQVSITILTHPVSQFGPDVIPKTTEDGYTLGIRQESGNTFTCLYTVSFTQEMTEMENAPQSLPYGMFSICMKTANPADTQQLTFFLPEPLTEDYLWYGYDETGWKTYPFTVNEAGTQASLTIRDGGEADRDQAENGMILFTSGPGIPPPTGEEEKPLPDDDEDTVCFVGSLF